MMHHLANMWHNNHYDSVSTTTIHLRERIQSESNSNDVQYHALALYRSRTIYTQLQISGYYYTDYYATMDLQASKVKWSSPFAVSASSKTFSYLYEIFHHL